MIFFKKNKKMVLFFNLIVLFTQNMLCEKNLENNSIKRIEDLEKKDKIKEERIVDLSSQTVENSTEIQEIQKQTIHQQNQNNTYWYWMTGMFIVTHIAQFIIAGFINNKINNIPPKNS